jgi:MFS transporter, BCD family, chlorophyll transporter
MSSTPPEQSDRALPKVQVPTMFRIGLFQMGLGIMSILTLGILNRILIDQSLLAIPGTIAGGILAMYQVVAPVRVLFGQLSDRKRILGLHRSGYIWIGAVGFTLCAFLAVQVMWRLADSLKTYGWTLPTYGWVAGLAVMFALYGLCLCFSSTPFGALLVDISDEDNRSKLVGVVWSMLIAGIAVGAITGGTLLKGLTPETLEMSVNRVFTILPMVVLGLVFLATVGIEKRYSRYHLRSTLVDREDQVTLKTALQVLTASRQTSIFFAFLIFMTLGLFLQQPILEPYAGEVFGMTPAQSTQLNAFWAIGSMIGIATTGFLIVPKLGKATTAKLGCLLVAGCFGVIIAAGLTQNPVVLQGATLILGLAMGVTTSSAVNLMLDLTVAETAGTFFGAWGLAQALAQALATATGGALLDIGRQWLSMPLPAYGFVFVLEALCMMVAITILNRIDVAAFQKKTQVAITTLLEQELTG